MQRLLPSDVQETLLTTQVLDPEEIDKKTGDLNLIGSIQIRVRYKFQYPRTVDHVLPNSRLLSTYNSTQNYLMPPEETYHPLSLSATKSSAHTAISNRSRRRSSYGRSDLAQEESYVDQLFKNQLSKIMTADIPSSAEPSLSSIRKQNSHHLKWRHRVSRSSSSSTLSNRFPSLKKEHKDKLHWLHQLVQPAKKLPKSSRGRRFGFSQHDSDDTHRFNPDNSSSFSSLSSSAPYTDRLAHGAKKKAKNIIDSVNFGDRDFATQWMQDSFEDVALSHPLLDKLIGLVVSKQTQAMVRAIIKTANAFGQGFRVTGVKLLKAFIVTQRFYEALPKPMPSPNLTIHDAGFIETACHYFSFALVAYGWRGLCYLGLYGQYVRGIRNRRSNRLAIIRYLRLDPENLLGYEYSFRKGASFQPSYYIAVDRSRKAIVLSIRGTWSLYDAITDLVCEYKPWKGGLVHSGMLASAQWFYTSIIPQIFRYIHHHPNELTSFIITGHSLGGGTSSLLTMMVADHIEELRELACNPHFELHCYNYAPAAVCSPNLGKQYEKYIHSFVCQDDVVGRLSYGTAMKLKELVLDTISAYGTLGGFRKVRSDREERKTYFYSCYKNRPSQILRLKGLVLTYLVKEERN